MNQHITHALFFILQFGSYPILYIVSLYIFIQFGVVTFETTHGFIHTSLTSLGSFSFLGIIQ